MLIYYCERIGEPTDTTAGIGIPFKLAGSKVARTSESIISGIVPEDCAPIWAAITFPRWSMRTVNPPDSDWRLEFIAFGGGVR